MAAGLDWSCRGKASLAVGEYLVVVVVVDEAERKGRTKVECKEEPLYQLFNPIQKGKTAKVPSASEHQ